MRFRRRESNFCWLETTKGPITLLRPGSRDLHRRLKLTITCLTKIAISRYVLRNRYKCINPDCIFYYFVYLKTCNSPGSNAIRWKDHSFLFNVVLFGRARPQERVLEAVEKLLSSLSSFEGNFWWLDLKCWPNFPPHVILFNVVSSLGGRPQGADFNNRRC